MKMESFTEGKQSKINFEELKWALCQSAKCMTCETIFYGCGRFCPNCLKPIHLHCAIKWAETQQKGKENGDDDYKVLRCPFCYYLLKIPISIHRQKIESSLYVDGNIIQKLQFTDYTSEIMTSLCAHPACGIMFDETLDRYVYKCQACHSYCHEACLLKSYSRNQHFPNCVCDSTWVN